MSDIVDDIDWGYYYALQTELYNELKAKLELAGGSIPISWDCGSDEVNFDVGPVSWGEPLWGALYDIVDSNVELWSAGCGYQEYGNGTMTLKEDTIEISYTTDMDEDYSEDIQSKPVGITSLMDYLRSQGLDDESFHYCYDDVFTWNSPRAVCIDVDALIAEWQQANPDYDIENELCDLMDDEMQGVMHIDLKSEGYTMRWDSVQPRPYKEGLIEIKPKDNVDDEESDSEDS